MYKLLLISDQPEIRAAYEAVDSWETLGFRAPRIARNTEEAADILQRHHVDAFAVNVAQEERAALSELLSGRYDQTPALLAVPSLEETKQHMEELCRVLNRIYGDYSNDAYDYREKMQLCRHSYFRSVLNGEVHNEAKMRRRLGILRSRMDADRPCVLIELAHPDDDGYLALHWRYGADRLEVALRNFFGAELNGMRILVSVLPNERLFLMACPMLGEQNVPAEAEMLEQVQALVAKNIIDVQEYLNIDLRVASVRVLPNLCALLHTEP